MKKLLALMLAMAMIVSLAGCSTPTGSIDNDSSKEDASSAETTTDATTEESTEEAAPTSGDTFPTEGKIFRYAVGTEPTTLDPNKGNSIGDNEIQHAITENLTRNTGGTVTAGLAESWDIDETGTIYTFHLRESYWSDGVKITANDFEYSWKRLADPATGSPYQFIVGILKNGNAIIAGEADVNDLGVKAIDENTLEVTLENPTSYFLSMLGSQSNFSPLRQDIVEQWGDDFAATAEKNVYSGPFKLITSENNEYQFIPNEYFWDRANIHWDGVQISYVEKEDTRLALYEQGELDYVAIPTAYVEQYKGQPNVNYFTNGNVDYCYINTESANPVWGNVNFRLALNYALNREEYNLLANNGVYSPYNALCFPGLQGKDGKTYGETYDVDAYAYPMTGDVDKAQEYLAKAMEELNIANASDIEIEFVTTDAEVNKRIAEVLQEQWQNALGIKVNIRQVTYSEIYGEVYPNMDYEIGYAGWGPDYDDPYTYLELFRSDVDWYTPYGNAEVDALLDATKTETDLNARMDMLNEAEQLLIADGAWVPLQARTAYYILDEDVTDITFYFCSVNIDWAYGDQK